MQFLIILLAAAFTVAVCLAFGKLVLGDEELDPALRIVTGAAILSLSVFGLCAAGLAYPSLFALLGISAIAGSRPPRRLLQLQFPKYLLLFTPYFLLYWLNAAAPEISYDGSRYHLALVGRYLREHGFRPISDNFYASLSQGVEMLYLFAYSFGRHSAASSVHFAFLLALAWMIHRYARRNGFPQVGACAASLVFTSPLVGADGASAYNDVAVAAIIFALFSLLQLWDVNRSPRFLIAIGLLAGFAYAAKYTAWVAVPYAVLFVAWKSRRPRDVAIVAACACVLIAPWMLKNWIFVQNPVAPFWNEWFPNPYVTPSFEREYRHNLAWAGITRRSEIPLQVTIFGSLSGPLGVMFLLAPVGLASFRRREGRQLLLAAAVFGATYFSNISARFLISALPFVALAMMLALERFPRIAIAIAVAQAVLSWPSILRQYCHVDAWHLVKIPWREALRIKPEDGFLHSNLPFYDVARLIEEHTPPGSTVFTFTPIPDAYTSRNVRVAYQSAAGIVSRYVLFSGFVPEHAPTWRLQFRFPLQELRALRLVQTATGNDTWSIHEVHVFEGEKEVPRDPAWKVDARPDPWTIGAAFDGRPLSFWICGENLRPGQSVEMDFGSTRRLDSLLIETAPNQSGIQLELQGRSDSGNWTRLGPAPAISDGPPPANLRRLASSELKRRGIDFVLLFDHEFGASDLSAHPDLWGIREVGEYRGARLYQLP